MMDNKDLDFDKTHIHLYDVEIPNLLKKAIEVTFSPP